MSNNRVKVIANLKPEPAVIKAASYSTVSFFDEITKRQIIVLYTLGADGIVREYAGGKWNAYPIHQE